MNQDAKIPCDLEEKPTREFPNPTICPDLQPKP